MTSLLYKFNGKIILTDCGEGTQIPVKLSGFGFKAIDAICFTHYHADHIAGLPGLLLTLGNSGRTEPLALFGPAGLKTVVDGLTVISPQLPFSLMLNELPYDQTAFFKIGEVLVSSLPADHRIPCLSYTFEIKRQGRFDKDKAAAADIPVKLWKELQSGKPVSCGDKVYTPDMVMGAPRKGIKVGYCTDTRPYAPLTKFMSDCDLLICEGMYGDSALLQKVSEKGHMVFSQAAEIAKESNSRELWLTHFSPAMPVPKDYLSEASKIFENTQIGKNLMKKSLNFDN